MSKCAASSCEAPASQFASVAAASFVAPLFRAAMPNSFAKFGMAAPAVVSGPDRPPPEDASCQIRNSDALEFNTTSITNLYNYATIIKNDKKAMTML